MLKKIIPLTFILAVIAGACFAAEETLPFRDTSLSFEERALDLVSRLTAEEKFMLLSETQEAVPRLGVGEYYFGNEALHGIVRPGNFTVFPQAIALGATWDPDLIQRVTTAMSDEARGRHNEHGRKMVARYSGLLAFWSPTVNMARDPRWGRTAETYGEDPWLSSRIGVAFVKGLQGNDPRYLKAVSSPKHYVANNEEHNRLECDARMSERALREYYLPAFRACITEGGAYSIMSAYNAVNSIPCTASKKLLTDILRGEWGFKGYVVSDCGAVSNLIYHHTYSESTRAAAAHAVNAGLDLECGSTKTMTNGMPGAIKFGLTDMETVDRAVYRVMLARMRLGMFDPPEMVPYNSIPAEVVGCPEHQQLALRTSQESIVLLKNEDAGGGKLLPLDLSKIKTIAVTGPNSAICRFGDYSGSPLNPPVNPLEGLRNRLGGSVEILHSEWVPAPTEDDFKPVTGAGLRTEDGENGLTAQYFGNKKFSGDPSGTRIETAIDIDTINKPPDPIYPPGSFSVRWTGRLAPHVSGSHRFRLTFAGGARVFLDGKLLINEKPEKKKAFKAGESFNIVKAANKVARTATFEAGLEAGREYDLVIEYLKTGTAAIAKLEWIHPAENRDAKLAAEMEMIEKSDIAIVFLGIGLEQEREGHDKDTLDLPGDQRDYIRSVLQHNPRTIVVLINGSPLSINWINDNVPAIVEAWYPGEQGGNAIADVLTGSFNPSGRLPVTFYKSTGELPAFDDYEVFNKRTYMYMETVPLYPFGYGLSYTGFEYSNISVDNRTAAAGDTVNVSFSVKNTGSRAGGEVAQLYVRDVKASVKRPNRQLRGFRRISLDPGETASVTIPLKVGDLGFWDDARGGWFVEPGEFEIMVGASSADIRLRDVLIVK